MTYTLVSGPATLTGSSLTITGAGTITLKASQGGDSSYAAATDVTATITVSPKALTITASNASRAYGAANPSTPGFTSTGLVGSDNISGVTYSYAATATATAATGSTHSITPSAATFSTGTAGNYTISYATGTLTIVGGAAQTITFALQSTATYGAAAITLSATATSTLPVTYTLVSGPATLTGSSLAITGAGTITLKASQGGDSSYAAATDVTTTITVSPKALTITASNATRSYGAANPATPDFTSTGLVGSDSISAVSYSYAATATATAATGSTHSITPSAATFSAGTAGNYTISYAAGTLTIVGGAAQTITFAPQSTATYGAAAITLSASATSTLPVTYTLVSGPATLTGSSLTITGAGTITLKASQGGDSSYAAATDVTASITVSPKALTITASNATRAYGAANPATPGFTSTGLVGSDNISAVSYNYAATATATAATGSTHSITPSAATFSTGTAGNYTISYAAGTLTIEADTTAPTLSISTLITGAVTSNATLNISGNATDGGSGIKAVTINNQPVTVTQSGTFSSVVTLTDGTNTIITIVTDNGGNTATDTRTIMLDRIAPTVSILTPADNSNLALSLIVISGTVNETSTVAAIVNGGSPQSAALNGNNFSVTLNLASGLNTVNVTATDLVGNTSTVKRTITSDTSLPSLTILTPGQDVTTRQDSIAISGTVADAVTTATISITADGQSYAPAVEQNGSFTQTIPLPTDKTYAVVVTATDQSGNSTTVQRNIINTASLTQPTISDALKVLQAVAGIKTLSASEQIYYDVAPLGSSGAPLGNGIIDAADVILLLRRSIGIGNW